MKKYFTNENTVFFLKIQNIPQGDRKTKTRHKLLFRIGHNINIQFKDVASVSITF